MNITKAQTLTWYTQPTKIKKEVYLHVMTKTTIIKNINSLLESIEDKEMLESIYDLLENYRNSWTLKTWDKLTDEQKSKILEAYSESEYDENLIPMDKVIKHK